jgi:hypothetical protein
MTEYVDFYFVPYHLLWRPFKQLVNPVPDVNSALSVTSEKNNSVTGVPYFTAAQVASMFTNATPGSSAQYTFFDKLPNRPFAARLLDMLSYYSDPEHAYLDVGGDVDQGQDNYWLQNFNNAYDSTWKFNPFRILAFNRILSDFYRATDYVQSNPRRFNIDDLDSGTQIPDERLRSLFHCMRFGDPDANVQGLYSCFPFAKWHLDRLISVKPSQLYGSFSAPTGVNSSNSIFGIRPNDGSVFAADPTITNGIVSTQDLRIAQSIEKIGRLAMCAPKTFRAQQAALFGESSPSCDNCTPRYLGSYDSSLDISEVTASTAYDSGNPDTSNYLGEVGGKGTSTNQKNGVINFKAEDFGVIIGVHYIVPDAEYQMNRYNRHCCKLTRSDFFNPAFDRLGLQPLYRGEVLLKKAENQTIVGMQARYIEYKTRENEIHGNFQRGRNLQSWSIPRNIDYNASDGVSRFYVHPDVVDSLFKANYDGTEVTDQFYCHYYFDQTIVQNKSAVGLPIL